MENRREHERYDAEVTAELDIGGDVLMAETRDVSSGGVKVEIEGEIEEGKEVGLTLILTEDGIEDPNQDPFEAPATVMWTAPTDGGVTMAGLRFGDLAADHNTRLTTFLAALANA